MSSEPITDSPDPRLQAALAEYLERIDRGEAVDRAAFLAEFPDLARELAPLLETGDALEEIGGNSGESRPPDLSTHSQLSHDIETVAPGRQGQEATTSGPLPVEFGRYRTIKPLGQGAMGVVYLAEDTQLHRKVALKTSSFDNDQSGELLERFYREARSAATLRHPNICPVYDVGEIQGRHYISMAYIEGRTLATYVNASGSLHERQVLVLVRKLALALQDAHQHEIVHRDLKPANIMVDLKGEPIIMDFGLARVGYSEEESRLTQVGMIVGSPAYMSPEQVGGRPELLTGAADQYSLGVILFELLVGHPPFRGSVTAVVGQILTQPPPRLSSLRSDVSPAVEALCLKMLAKSPSERFASMKHVAEEIATLLRGSSTEKAPAGQEDRATPATSIPKTSLHAALVEEARQRLKQRDYPKAIEMLQQIPEADRPPEAAKLLAQALKLMDEVNFVLQEMEAALQSRDGATLAKRAQELVKLKPDHPRARQVRELIKKHGPERALQFLAENSGATSTSAPPRKLWIGSLAAGLAVLFAIVWLQFGDSRVKVEILAEGYEVKFNEAEITITDGTRETKVKPGEHTLHIKSLNPGDGETVEEFDTEKLTLKKGGQAVLTVTRENAEVVAKLDGQVIPRRSLAATSTGQSVPDPQPLDTYAVLDTGEKALIYETSGELIENSNGAKAQPAGSIGWKVVSGQWNLPDSSDNFFADPNAGFFAGNVPSGIIEQVVDVSRFADAIDNANVEFKLSWKLASFDADVGAVAMTSLDSDQKEMATAYDSGWQNNQPWNNFKRFDSSIVPAKGVRYFRLRVSAQRSRRPGNVQCSANIREISLQAVVKKPFTPPSVSEDGPWVSLFNGKDLTNWKLHASQPGGWAVKDGLLVGSSWDANHLFTESGDFENFHLRAELKTEHQSNGGIYFRAPFALDNSDKSPRGYEAEIRHFSPNGPWTGCLLIPGTPLVEQLPHERLILSPGEWFTMDVIAMGNIFIVKVNGKTTKVISDGKNNYRTGHIAIQSVVEKGVTTPTIVHFKKIEVKRLKMANTATPDAPKPSTVREGEIDLLAAVDVSQLGDSDMKWERKGQTVVCTGTGAAGKSAWKGFRLPTEIGGDYEVELDFQQRAFWPMQIDFPLQDTVLRVSLTGDYCDLMIEEDKTQPNAEKTWRSQAATLKTMVPQKLVVRVRQSGSRAEIEATLDGVTLGTYSGERNRLVLPSWVNPNFKQITSGSLCGNLAEGYIELRKAVYRPLTNSASNPPPAVAPAKDSISTGTVRPAQLPSDAGLPLRWLSLSVHDPSVFDAAANLANVIEDRSWQLHGDALTRKARQRGVPTIVSFHRKEFIEFLAGRAPEFETKLHAFVGANRDVIAGVNFLSPYTNDARECIEHVGPFGRRLKAAFPGLSYWVSYIESPAGWTGPLPVIPPEVDVVEMQTYYAMTPLMVQEHFDQHLPTWKARANGRPQTFRWVTAQLDGAPKVLKTESGTVDRVLTTSGRLGLTGVVLDHFGGREDGWSPPLESDTTALSELTKYSHRYGYGTREKHSENALMSQLSDTESGWTDLFNGRDLTGWSGLTSYWKWSNGELVGTLPAPLTQRNTVLRHDRTFRDFEIEYEMKLEGNPGNSGLQIRSELMDPAIFLASGPQVDAGGAHWGGLSGELFGDTIMRAAKPAGTIKLNDYNKFHVRCVGTHITITLNGSVTVDGDFPTIADEGILGWQLHGRVPSTVRLRNVRIRELNQPAMAAVAAPSPDTLWTDLFNGHDLNGWTALGVQGWRVENGVLIGETQDAQGWLMSSTEYDNCEFDFEYRLGPGTNGGVFLRAWADGPVSGKDFLEVQLLDESDEVFRTMPPSRRTGALYDILEARSLADLRPNLWHRMNISIHDQDIRVTVNGQEVTRGKVPAGKQPHGHLGLQLSPRTKPQRCEFQKLRVRPLKDGLPIPGTPAQPNAPMVKIEPAAEQPVPEDPEEDSAAPDEIRNGLKAEIYAGQNFDRKVTERIEPDLDCFWNLAAPASGVPVDGFSVRFSGWLKAPRTGRYKIGFSSDDGLRVSIDGRKVIDDWKVGEHYREASVELTEEPQSIQVETFDSTGSAFLSAYWLPTGQSTPGLIPTEAFFLTEESARTPAAKSSKQRHGLMAEYFDPSFTKKLGTHRVIRAETSWHTATPLWGLPTALAARYSGYVVPPTTGQYKLVGLGDDWMRVWIDNKPALEAKFEHGIQTALISLEAGKPHAIRIEHANSYLDGEYLLHWVEPGKTEEVSIPPECLFPTKAAANRAASKKPNIKTPEKPVEKMNAAELPEVRHGLKAEIFEGQNFDKKICERIEPNVECFWELGAPAKDAPVDNFSVRFSGWLRAPKPGRYKLLLHCAEGSRMKINQQLVVDNWKNRGPAEVSLDFTEEAQPIEVEVYDVDGPSWISLLWQQPGALRPCPVPSEAFFPDEASARSRTSKPVSLKTGLIAEYYDKSFTRKLGSDRTYRAESNWYLGSPMWGLPTESAARYTGVLVPPESGQYKLIAWADNHVRVWIDEKPAVEAILAQPYRVALIDLEAGKPYDIRIEFANTEGPAAYHVHWVLPNTTKEVSIPPGCLFPNKAAAKLAQSPKVTSEVPADGPLVPGEWIDLFNGRDLTGWEVVNDKGIFPNTMDAGWSVIDGAIQCQSPDHGWLRSVREFEDFDLELKCRFTGPQKSSVILRTRGPIAPLADGLWVDLQHSAAGGVALAKIDSQPRLLPSGEWNQLRIEARGTKYHVEVNGHPTADADLATHQWAASLEQAGRIGLNNYKGQANGIAFRDIRIRPVLRTAPSTISATERETIERGLAQLKADEEAAGKKLLKAFDEQIEKVRSAPKLSADERVVKIKSLEDEKALFEKHAQIPFSLAVRTETLKYLREFTEARTDAAKVYDKLIESLTKQKKDELASLMRTERDIAVGPKVLATWQTTEVNGGKKADWSIWSDGSVGKPDRQFLWMMDERRFVIQWRKDPPWVAAFDIQPDSLKADVYNEQRVHVIRAVRAAP